MLVQTSNRLVLRFDPGQFSFRHFVSNANDEQMYNLALALNSFQDEPVRKILKVQEYELAS